MQPPSASSAGFTGFVVTRQRPAELERTLATLLAQTRPPEALLVVDNGGSAKTAAVVRGFADRGVAYLDAGGNLGPAGAAALALARLLALGTDGGVEVGALGAVGALWDERRGRLERLPDERLTGTLEVDMVAGGSQWILSAAAVRAVGPPDARLFFGLEELEYSLRLRRAGYRLLVDGELMRTYRELTGRLGLGRRPLLAATATPPWRQYYSTRNYVFMMRHTFDRPDLARRQAVRAVAKGLAGWRHGARHGARSLTLQLRAVRDGYRGRLGRTERPASP